MTLSQKEAYVLFQMVSKLHQQMIDVLSSYVRTIEKGNLDEIFHWVKNNDVDLNSRFGSHLRIAFVRTCSYDLKKIK